MDTDITPKEKEESRIKRKKKDKNKPPRPRDGDIVMMTWLGDPTEYLCELYTEEDELYVQSIDGKFEDGYSFDPDIDTWWLVESKGNSCTANATKLKNPHAQKFWQSLCKCRLTDALAKKQDAAYFACIACIGAVLWQGIFHGDGVWEASTVCGIHRIASLVAFGVCVYMYTLLLCKTLNYLCLPCFLMALSLSLSFSFSSVHACMPGCQPIASGFLLRYVFGDAMPVTWPFHKEKLWGPLGLHLCIGLVVTTLPVYALVAMILA